MDDHSAVPLSKHKSFVKHLLKVTGGALSLSQLTLKDGATPAYVTPASLEQAVHSAKDWQAERFDRWFEGIECAGRQCVECRGVFRPTNVGQIRAAMADFVFQTQPVGKKVPCEVTGRKIKPLPSLFEGPDDWHLQGCKVPQAC